MAADDERIVLYMLQEKKKKFLTAYLYLIG